MRLKENRSFGKYCRNRFQFNFVRLKESHSWCQDFIYKISIQFCAIKRRKRQTKRLRGDWISIQFCAIKSAREWLGCKPGKWFQFNFVRLKVKNLDSGMIRKKFQFNFVRLKVRKRTIITGPDYISIQFCAIKSNVVRGRTNKK